MKSTKNIQRILLQLHMFTFFSTVLIWEHFELDTIIYLQWLLTAIPVSIVLYINSKYLDNFANKVLEQEKVIITLEEKLGVGNE